MASDLKMEGVHHVESTNGNGNALSRQVTVTMSPEHYERLFFQPESRRGESSLSKQLGRLIRPVERLLDHETHSNIHT